MADRAFRQLVFLALVTSMPLMISLALTLFPGAIQQALHGYDGFVQTCLAAVYGVGQRLPPVGLVTLGLALAATLAASARALALALRTRALTARCRSLAPPMRLGTVAARLGIAERLTLFASPIALAFTAGLAHPRIYISTATLDALSADELEAVLLHERAHLLRRDPLRIAIARSISSALFFVPLAEALQRRFDVAKELDADRAVLAAQRGVAPLAGALERLGSAPELRAQQLAIGAWSCATARIDQLEGAEVSALLPSLPSRTSWLSALALALLLALALGQATRANIVPAAAWELSGGPTTAKIHVCPVPLEGPLF